MIWRYILATVLSVIVIIAFQQWFPPPPPQERAPAGPEAPGRVDPAQPDARIGEGPGRVEPGRPADAAAGTTDSLIACQWAEGQGHLQSLDARGTGDGTPDAMARLTEAVGDASGPLGLAVRVAADAAAAADPAWTNDIIATWEPTSPAVEETAEPVAWAHRTTVDGITIVRTVTIAGLSPDGKRLPGSTLRHVKVSLTFENTADAARTFAYELTGPASLRAGDGEAPGRDIYLASGTYREDGTVEARLVPARDIPAAGFVAEERVAWIGGVGGRYLVALYPLSGSGPASRHLARATAVPVPFAATDGVSYGGLRAALRSVAVSLKAGEKVTHDFGLYAGPRDGAALAPYHVRHFTAVNQMDIVLSPRFRVVCDSGSGSVSALTLEKYKEEIDGDASYRLLFEPRRAPETLSLELYERRGADYHPLGFSTSAWAVRTEPGDRPSLVLEATREGLHVIKRISAASPDEVFTASEDVRKGAAEDPDGAHHLRVTVEVRNVSSMAREVYYKLHGPAAIGTESLRRPGYDIAFGFGVFEGAGHMNVPPAMDADDLPDGQWERSEGLAWAGITNSYFASILLPLGEERGHKASFIDNGFASNHPDWEKVKALVEEKDQKLDRLSDRELDEIGKKAFKNLRTGFTSTLLSLDATGTVAHEYLLFAGPREKHVFARYEELDFAGINYYGWFSPLVRLFIFLLETLRTLAAGSWGVGIILLTLLVKLCLHPINKRSQRSMMRFQKKMQKVKPQMDALKEQFGEDRMAMNREMQKLWKEHGINPAQQMAGCMIIFLQLPIWIGLYTTLQYAIGLRHAPFLYINDLTAPDAMFPLGFTIPILGWFVPHFNLLPILYVILTVVNQRLQPKPADPQMQTQHKMMSFMMIFFGVIFYKFPAGFMLYIMTSAGLGIIESKIIKAQINAEDEQLSGAAGAAPAAAAYPARSKGGGGKGDSRGGGGGPTPRKGRKRGRKK